MVFRRPGAVKCARLEFSGCRVKPQRPQKPRGFTRQPESPNVHISGSRPSEPPPIFHEKTPKRGKKAKLWREREKKRNFGRSDGGEGGVRWSGAGWSGESEPATTTTTPPEWGGGRARLPGFWFGSVWGSGLNVGFWLLGFWVQNLAKTQKHQHWPKSAMTDILVESCRFCDASVGDLWHSLSECPEFADLRAQWSRRCRLTAIYTGNGAALILHLFSFRPVRHVLTSILLLHGLHRGPPNVSGLAR